MWSASGSEIVSVSHQSSRKLAGLLNTRVDLGQRRRVLRFNLSRQHASMKLTKTKKDRTCFDPSTTTLSRSWLHSEQRAATIWPPLPFRTPI
jgi:hypothetical protein